MKTLTKEVLLEKYKAATSVRYHQPEAIWNVFPGLASLREFREEVGGLSFPESWGSSPWETAFSIAFLACGAKVTNPFTIATKEHAIAMEYRVKAGLSTERLSDGTFAN